MIASASADPAHRSWWTNTHSDLAPAFRRAQRHSRLVRFLRYALPGGLVGVVLLYGLASWLNPFTIPGMPSMANLVISGTRVTMDSPRLGGYTRDGRPYELTASAAAQDLKRPQFIELKEIRAKVELRDGSTVNVTGDTGLYDTKADQVSLRDNIVVQTTNGMNVRLREATIDVKAGHIVSREPVEVLTADGRIEANGLEIAEQGAVINFRGGVRVEMRPASSSQQKSQAERSQ